MAEHPSLGGVAMALGGNVFGWTLDRDGSFAVLDAFYEAGGRMVDTAEGYSAWVPGNKGGESEAILGEWLESRGVRKDMRIGTKTGMQGTLECLQQPGVTAALQGSLERLRSDYVDLYYVHMDNGTTPLADIAGAFDATIQSGKARELGLSNFSAARLFELMQVTDQFGITPFTVLQPKHNLVSRAEFSGPMQDLAKARGLAVFPFFSLASGFLTGKFRSDDDWGATARNFTIREFATPAGWAALEGLEAVAGELEARPAQVALAWLLAQDGITAPIVSATSPRQLLETMGYLSLKLEPSQLERLDAAFA